MEKHNRFRTLELWRSVFESRLSRLANEITSGDSGQLALGGSHRIVKGKPRVRPQQGR